MAGILEQFFINELKKLLTPDLLNGIKKQVLDWVFAELTAAAKTTASGFDDSVVAAIKAVLDPA